MQLKQIENTEIVIGGGKELMFTIDDSNPVIFDILRNKMYSNKIGAVCREIASNSRDANREAGLADLKTEIEFTDSDTMYGIGDTCIVFRDFGIGITPDRMENIFMKYAASTKRGSDSQTGGFGLGAKTPFAYTDSFIVKTVCEVEGNKREYTYNAIIDKSGKGKMIEISNVESDSHTGTEIIIPVLTNDDRYKFEKECYYATMFWNTITYINFNSKISELNVIIEGNGFKIVKDLSSTSFNSNYIGLLDGIPYPIYPTVHSRGLGSNFRVLMDLDFSKITINANRESIQNDKETMEYVDYQVKKINSQLEEQVEEYLTNNETFREAVTKYLALNKKRFYSSKTAFSSLDEILYERKNNSSDTFLLPTVNTTIYFEDEKITKALSLKAHTFSEVEVRDLQTSGEDFISCSSKYNTSIDFSDLLSQEKIYLMDKGRISLIKNYQIVKGKDRDFILLKRNVGAQEEDLKEDLELFAKLDLEIVNYSEVEVSVKKASNGSNKSETIQVIVREREKYYSEYWSFNTIAKKLYDDYDREIDKSSVAFIPLSSINSSFKENDKTSVISLEKEIKYLKINASTFMKHLHPNGFLAVDAIFNKINLKKYEKVLDYKEICSIFDRQIPSILVTDFLDYLPKSVKTILKTRKELELLFTSIPKSKINSVSWKTLGIEKSKFDYEGLVDKYKKMMHQKYPMLLPYLKSVDFEDLVEKERALKITKNYITCHY